MSRQRDYQKRKIAQGLCCTCGKKPLFTKTQCKPCSRRISKEKAAARLKRQDELKKKKLALIKEIRKRVVTFARIDQTFEYVKVAKILSAVAKAMGVTDEAVRRYYNKKIFLENKSILNL